jgi:hypothetical protein
MSEQPEREALEKTTPAEAWSLAHRAVTEGVNLRYVEQMRRAL